MEHDPLDYPTWIDRSTAQGTGRMPNFMHPPGPGEAFSAGGLIPVSGVLGRDDRRAITDLMSNLEWRMWNAPGDGDDHGELWSEPLLAGATANGVAAGPAAANLWENPGLPAGYTYLLQLVAHDLVDGVRSATIGVPPAGGPALASLRPRNARARPLMLDTIYGDGPDQSPQAYSVAQVSAGRPRLALRTGDIQHVNGAAPALPAGARFCPFRDIARARDREAPGAGAWTEALIADPRNDAHALISQLTVLFHQFHNKVIGLLPRRDGSKEGDYRRFLCARQAVTLIYRHIVAGDLMPRILAPAILAAYRSHPGLRLHGEGIPLEFSAGAFRFGHSLVRIKYRTNGMSAGLLFFKGLELSSRRKPGSLPMPRSWAVDWALFFDPAAKPNLARRIGPFHSGGLMQEPSKHQRPPSFTHPPSASDFKDSGLPTRDLLASTYAGLWSAPALNAAIRAALADAGLDRELLPDFAIWNEALEAWFAPAENGGLLSPRQADRLIADPPLPFFILFEAAHDFDPVTRRPRPAQPDADGFPRFPGQGGRHLGPLGSIIVADILFAALREQPFGFSEAGMSLRQRIATVAEGLVGDAAALDGLTLSNGRERRLDTMLDVLEFMFQTA